MTSALQRRVLVARRLRLLGREIARNLFLPYAMRSCLWGLGLVSAMKICETTGINPYKKTFELSEEEELRLIDEIGNWTLENPLKRMIKANCVHKASVKSKVGSRYAKGMPVHARKETRRNCRTSRKMNP